MVFFLTTCWNHAVVTWRSLCNRNGMMRIRLALAVPFVVAGCTTTTTATSAPPTGNLARLVDTAAREAGVPQDLLLAISIEEGGITLPAFRVVRDDDNVPVAGLLELRHGRLDTLALGAQLSAAQLFGGRNALFCSMTIQPL